MDVISEAIGSVRAGRAYGRRIGRSGLWGMRFPSFTGVGFHVVLRGHGWLVASGVEPAALGPGDVVLAPNGAEHGISHAPARIEDLSAITVTVEPQGRRPDAFEFLCGAYHLNRGQLHPFLRGLPAVIVISPDYDRHPELRSLANVLEDDLSEPLPGSQVTRSALVDLMLVHVLRQWHEKSGTATWPAVADPAVATALREMHRRPQHGWTVQRLAEIAGMRRTAFARRFAALVGVPPMAYLTYWRLTCGARLLRQTSDPLATIARQIGYSTEFAFAGAFSREFGVAPGRFRHLPDPLPAQRTQITDGVARS